MKRTTKIFLSVAGILACVGCLQTREDLKGSEESRESQPRYNVPPSIAAAPAHPIAGDPDRNQELLEQVRNLNGRIEVLENELQTMRAAKAAESTASLQKEQELENKVALLTETVGKLENQMGQMSSSPQGAAAPEPEETASARKGPLAQAEEDYKNKNWKSAIVNFQKYRATKGNGKSYAAATYKMAVCFQELGMKQEAKSFFEEVVAKYPGTDDAKKAQFRLKQLR